MLIKIKQIAVWQHLVDIDIRRNDFDVKEITFLKADSEEIMLNGNGHDLMLMLLRIRLIGCSPCTWCHVASARTPAFGKIHFKCLCRDGFNLENTLFLSKWFCWNFHLEAEWRDGGDAGWALELEQVHLRRHHRDRHRRRRHHHHN